MLAAHEVKIKAENTVPKKKTNKKKATLQRNVKHAKGNFTRKLSWKSFAGKEDFILNYQRCGLVMMKRMMKTEPVLLP